jgi:hypothetical protein
MESDRLPMGIARCRRCAPVNGRASAAMCRVCFAIRCEEFFATCVTRDGNLAGRLAFHLGPSARMDASCSDEAAFRRVCVRTYVCVLKSCLSFPWRLDVLRAHARCWMKLHPPLPDWANGDCDFALLHERLGFGPSICKPPFSLRIGSRCQQPPAAHRAIVSKYVASSCDVPSAVVAYDVSWALASSRPDNLLRAAKSWDGLR